MRLRHCILDSEERSTKETIDVSMDVVALCDISSGTSPDSSTAITATHVWSVGKHLNVQNSLQFYSMKTINNKLELMQYMFDTWTNHIRFCQLNPWKEQSILRIVFREWRRLWREKKEAEYRVYRLMDKVVYYRFFYFWKEFVEWQYGLPRHRLEYHISWHRFRRVINPIFTSWQQYNDFRKIPKQIRVRLRTRLFTQTFSAWKTY